jgi:hypothetical protein
LGAAAGEVMINLKYSLVIEATEDHISVLRQQGLPIPTINPNPTVVIQNDPKALKSALAK